MVWMMPRPLSLVNCLLCSPPAVVTDCEWMDAQHTYTDLFFIKGNESVNGLHVTVIFGRLIKMYFSPGERNPNDECKRSLWIALLWSFHSCSQQDPHPSLPCDPWIPAAVSTGGLNTRQRQLRCSSRAVSVGKLAELDRVIVCLCSVFRSCILPLWRPWWGSALRTGRSGLKRNLEKSKNRETLHVKRP